MQSSEQRRVLRPKHIDDGGVVFFTHIYRVLFVYIHIFTGESAMNRESRTSRNANVRSAREKDKKTHVSRPLRLSLTSHPIHTPLQALYTHMCIRTHEITLLYKSSTLSAFIQLVGPLFCYRLCSSSVALFSSF